MLTRNAAKRLRGELRSSALDGGKLRSRDILVFLGEPYLAPMYTPHKYKHLLHPSLERTAPSGDLDLGRPAKALVDLADWSSG